MKLLIRSCFFCSLVVAVVSPTYAAPDNITIPQGFASTFIPYMTVDKRDREPHVVRFMYISPNTRDTESDQDLPEGTQIVMVERLAETAGSGETTFNESGRMVPTNEVFRIIVSEKRSGIGDEYHEDMRIGDWEFGVFQPDGSPWPDVDFAECRACHRKASQTDFTFSVFRNLPEISSWELAPGQANEQALDQPKEQPRFTHKPTF